MKLTFSKQSGGVLIPASDIEADKMQRFKSGELYTVEIKLPRNPAFHGKVFAFLNFCFGYWKCDREFLNESGQFDLFRENLTVLAGFKDVFYTIDGRLKVVAKSLSFSAMTQDEFEGFYHAIIQAAMTHLFDPNDTKTQNKLYSFF